MPDGRELMLQRYQRIAMIGQLTGISPMVAYAAYRELMFANTDKTIMEIFDMLEEDMWHGWVGLN